MSGEIQRIETMTDEQLDAELRASGLDPEQVVNNMISKLCELVRAKSATVAELQAEVDKLKREAKLSDEVTRLDMEALEAERDSLKAQIAAMQWTPITPENLPKVGDELIGQRGKVMALPEGYAPAIPMMEDFTYAGWTHFRPIGAPNAKER